MIRVLIVSEDDFSSPAEMQILGFAEALHRAGHRVMMSMAGDPESHRREGLEILPDAAVWRHRFRGLRLDGATVRRARSFAPDVVHAWNPRAGTLAASRAFARATGAAWCIHFEDDHFTPWPAPTGLPLRVRGRLAVQRACWPLHPPWGREAVSTGLGWARRNATALDALTPALAEEVSRQLGRDCACLLPVIVAQDAGPPFPPADIRVGSEAVALFTGRVAASSIHDLDLGLAAVAQVRARGHDLRLVQTGAVHDGLDLVARAARYGLDADGFETLGHLPFGQVVPTLRAADVLIQPGAASRFNRLRLPSKMQNYLASGTPVITFGVGFAELLTDRVEVLKTYGDDASELADRVEEVLTDPALRQRLSEGGPQAAARLFDVERNTAALVAHYREAIRRHRGGGAPVG